MANLSSTVSLIFNGVNNVGQTVDEVNRNLSSISSFATSFTSPFASIADDILTLDAALIALGGSLAALAFNEAVKAESAILDLSKVLTDADPPAQQLRESLKELALQYGVSANELVQSTADFIQAGFNTEDALLLVKNALDLVIAGDVEAAQASEILISALKGFKVEAADAAHFIEVINAASNKYATNVEQLAIGMSKLSPIASTMGLTFEETADLLIPIIEVFRSGDEAAIALKTGLLRLVDPTTEAEERLNQLGVAVRDANGNLRNAKDITNETAKAFVALEDSNRLAAASVIFGKDQAARLSETFVALGRATVDVASIMGTVPSVLDEVTIRLASADNTINRFLVSVQELGVTTGNTFKVEFQDIIESFSALIGSLDGALQEGNLRNFVSEFANFLAPIDEAILKIAENLPKALDRIDFSGVLGSLGLLGETLNEVFSAFFGNINITTVDGLAVVLQKVVDSFSSLIRVSSGIVQSFVPVIDTISNVVDQFSRLDTVQALDFGNFLGLAKQIQDFGLAATTAFQTINVAAIELGRVFDGVAGIVGVVFNGLQITIDSVSLLIVRSLERVVSGVNEIPDFLLPESFERGLDTTQASLKALGDAIEQNLIKNTNEAEQAYDRFAGAFDDANGPIVDTEILLRRLADGTKEFADDVSNVDLSPFKNELEQIGSLLEKNISLEEFDEAIRKFGDNFTIIDGQIVPVLHTIEEIESGIQKLEPAAQKAAGGLPIVSKAITDVGKKADEAKQKTESFELKLLELASNERIRQLELGVDINIAQIEAETARIEAAFNSLNVGIESVGESFVNTGDVLSDLASIFAETESKFDQAKIDRLIEDEAERRDRLLELQEKQFEEQKKLIDAQVKLFEERIKRLARGDPLITINGDGLEPELEAFMFRILEKIQIRANEESQQYLLGVG